MQVSDLVSPMLSALRPEHGAVYVANPQSFGGVRRLVRDIERAGFGNVHSRWVALQSADLDLFTRMQRSCAHPVLDDVQTHSRV